MPLHDWTDERGLDSVHPFWLAYMVEWVQPRLPKGYRAYLGSVPALTPAAGEGRPDVGVRRWEPEPPVHSPGGEAVVIEPDLEARAAVRLDPQPAVHVDLGGRLVAAIELVSPRNKDRAAAKTTYSARYLGYLRLGVHLMLIDVLPRPRGFSFADTVASDLTLETPPLPPPFAAAYRVGEVVPTDDGTGSLVGVWQRPLEIGMPLPLLPLALSIHDAVIVDLEETYRRAAQRAYLE